MEVAAAAAAAAAAAHFLSQKSTKFLRVGLLLLSSMETVSLVLSVETVVAGFVLADAGGRRLSLSPLEIAIEYSGAPSASPNRSRLICLRLRISLFRGEIFRPNTRDFPSWDDWVANG